MADPTLEELCAEISQKCQENIQYIEDTKELFAQFCENADNVTYDDVSSRLNSVYTCLCALEKSISYFYEQAAYKRCADLRKLVRMSNDQYLVLLDDYQSLRHELSTLVTREKELV